MFNSETLEVAIGMAFLFLTMALICTAIQEWIEGIMKWRAMDLERGIRTLLNDPHGKVAKALYSHPMISALFQGHYDPVQLRPSSTTPGQGARHVRLGARRHLPSYIPAEHFATALIDYVVRGPALGDGQSDNVQPITAARLRESAAAIAEPHLRRAMLAALDHAGDNLQAVRKNLENWFDGTMDRTSGWYKRRAQSILFLLGIGAAVVLNVDALHVIQRLVADKSFREAVVKQAETTVKQADPAKPPDAGRTKDGATAQQTTTQAKDRLNALQSQLRDVGMPIGWKAGKPIQLELLPTAAGAGASAAAAAPAASATDGGGPEQPGCTFRGADCWNWLPIGLGWLVTAFAVMLGAPFWFDVLNRFMVLRSTVKPREKSPEEGSKDKPPAAAPAAPAPQVREV